MRSKNLAILLVCLLSSGALGQRSVTIASCTSSHGQNTCNQAFDGITTGTSNGWKYEKPDSTPWGYFKLAEASDVSGVSILSGVDRKNRQIKSFSIWCEVEGNPVDVKNVRLFSGRAALITGNRITMAGRHRAIRVDFDTVSGCTGIGLQIFSTFSHKNSNNFMLTELSIHTGTVFSLVAAPGACLPTARHDIGKVFGNAPHTIQVRLTFPKSEPTRRQWILNLGHYGTGAHHWIWNSKQVQFGRSNGQQIQNVDITQCTYLTTTFSGSVLKLYCDGVFMAERNMNLDIKSDDLNIAPYPYGGEVGFAGCISEVAVHSYEKSAAEVAQQNPPAFWKTCRWHAIQDDHLFDTKGFMGWTCADNEILTGFGINANEDDVSKIKCCELGGHSSVVPNSCNFIEVGDAKFNPESATCNANDHMVFSGAYDKTTLEEDAFTEVAVGKCCKVECDAPWCNEASDWGVNTDKCQTIAADPNYTGPQNLVCPEGTLVTKIHDGHKGRAQGIQKVQSVECCELDLVSQPSKAPTVGPTFAPSRSPTNAPSPSPTTAPTPSPTNMPSVAPTTTPECLLAFVKSKSLSDAEILEGIDSCLPCYAAPRKDLRKPLKRRLMENVDRN